MLRPHPEVEIVGECDNGFEAGQDGADLRPDSFPRHPNAQLDGFEVLELIGTGMAIIFTTATISTHCAPSRSTQWTSLLKPRSRALHAALDRAKRRLDNRRCPTWRIRRLSREVGHYAERIVVKMGRASRSFPLQAGLRRERKTIMSRLRAKVRST